MKRSAWLAMALVAAILPTGCVTRRYVITSNPPGALVYRDGQPIGATPVEESFLYYGKYNFRLVKDGYEPLDVMPKLAIPWYEYPGIDFVSETLIPWTFRDVQVLHFELQPVVPVRMEDLRTRGNEIKERGKLIQPPPGVVAPTRRPPPPPPAGAPATPSLPPPTTEPPLLPPPTLPPATLQRRSQADRPRYRAFIRMVSSNALNSWSQYTWRSHLHSQ